jgi:apolipoprotein N-acyltransferase
MKQKFWKHEKGLPLFAGIAGSALLVFMSWRQNMPLAAWLIPFLFLYSFRNLKNGWFTLPVAVLGIAAKIAAMHGGWDIDFGMEAVFGLLVSIPLLAALYLDRILRSRIKPLMATLIFPAVYTALDFLLSLSPVGMTFSLAYTQSRQLLLAQSSALAGSWLICFIVAWTCSLANTVLGEAAKGRSVRLLITVYVLVMTAFLGFGSVKQTFQRPDGETVRIGSVTMAMPIDAWSITDAGTPREGADENKAVFSQMNDGLFLLSKKAADAGSKIVFWSEGNYVIYDDQYDDFVQKAQTFAKSNGVYLMATPLVLHFDRNKNDNLAIMFDPNGNQLFRYEKTNSWYPTDSDGIIPKADTPYGKIGTAICFDMDFPAFIRQAADVDIMLVPAYDTKKISPFHTEGALQRGMEYGFSVVRQCDAGDSIAADYNGNILAAQSFFSTKERLMISDVPTKGIQTPYEFTGDWLAYAAILLTLFFIGYGVLNMRLHCGE